MLELLQVEEKSSYMKEFKYHFVLKNNMRYSYFVFSDNKTMSFENRGEMINLKLLVTLEKV